jgi:hypothetical protein
MNRKATVGSAFVGIIFLVLSAAAFGQVGSAPTDDKKIDIELKATPLGERLGMAGLAVKAVENGIEMFGVRAVGKMQDRALLEVVIVRDDGEFTVGTIEMFLGSGKLVLERSKDRSAAFPISRLQGVYVTYRGRPVLSGQFPS